MIEYKLTGDAYDLVSAGANLRASCKTAANPRDGPVGDIVALICKEEDNTFSVYSHIQTGWNSRVNDERRRTVLYPFYFGGELVLLGGADFSHDGIAYAFNTRETICPTVEYMEHKSDVLCSALRGSFRAGSQAELEERLAAYSKVANQIYLHLFDPRNTEAAVGSGPDLAETHLAMLDGPSTTHIKTPEYVLKFVQLPPERESCLHSLQTIHRSRVGVDLIFDVREAVGKIVGGDNAAAEDPLDSLRRLSWSEIGGFQEQKDQVTLFVDNWLDPESVKFAGLDPTKTGGMIFLGPTGWGKSIFADAAATYAVEQLDVKVHYLFRSYGHHSSKWRGEEAARIRADFKRIRELNQKGERVIYFLEEAQAIGERDQVNEGGGNELLNQLLVELTGVDYGMAFVMAATARDPSKIDSQLLRPGRLGEQVYFRPPLSQEDAADIVRVIVTNNQRFASEHAGNENYVASEGIDYSSIGQQLGDFSPAEVAHTVARALRPKIVKYRKEKEWEPLTTEEILSTIESIRVRRMKNSTNADEM